VIGRLASGVAVVALLAIARAVDAGEVVDVTATDGVQLLAELDGASGPGIVLVHGPGADRRVYAASSEQLAARGFRVLRLDLRGHGASEGTADAAAIDRDVEGAYRYLLGRKIRPVFLIAAGVAGTAALAVASRVEVAGVVTLSSSAAPSRGAPVLRLGDASLDDEATLARVVAFLRAPAAPAARRS
jgi:pimeloyl-ACP methyl ester carboxylesterase